MKFLLRSFTRWANSVRSWLPSRFSKGKRHDFITSRELAASESVSRFIYSSNSFSHQRNRPKPVAFTPEPYPELSTVHIEGLSDLEIWRVAQRTLGTQKGRDRIYGRIDLEVSKVIAQKLKAIRDDDPFERHTSVVGWPQYEDKNKQKADIKAICLALSEDPEVRLVLSESPIVNTSIFP